MRLGSAAMYRKRAALGDLILVATTASDLPVAYALLEPDGHLDQLYCHPDHSGCGLADSLLARAERHAREHRAKRLYTEASELARSAFERAGYVLSHRRDFTIDGEGGPVAIHNYAMGKRLK